MRQFVRDFRAPIAQFRIGLIGALDHEFCLAEAKAIQLFENSETLRCFDAGVQMDIIGGRASGRLCSRDLRRLIVIFGHRTIQRVIGIGAEADGPSSPRAALHCRRRTLNQIGVDDAGRIYSSGGCDEGLDAPMIHAFQKTFASDRRWKSPCLPKGQGGFRL
ncbi:hypothetical protein BRX36_13405 [Sphingomonas sp. S-NIH.Pt1_0416]|nr:hypothetical protein BRX36_13405 [Sphingomonas sp. S-NIH.Pt1_0416]